MSEELEMSDEIMSLKGTNGTILVYEDRVVISRKGFFAAAAQGVKGDRTFFYTDITTVDFKRPTLLANGYITFIAGGTMSQPVGNTIIGTTKSSTLHEDNTVVLRAFKKAVPEEAQRIYDFIMPKIAETKVAKTSQPAASSADEIRKYKQLMDDGIISEEEYENKKSQLLGL